MNFENHQTQKWISQTVRAQKVGEKKSSIWIEGPGQKLFNCVLRGEVGWKENKERTKRSRKNLCIKHRGSFLKNKFTMLSGLVEGQNLSGWF